MQVTLGPSVRPSLSEMLLAGVVRRAASRPISIIRSTSVPGQLQDRSQPPAAPGTGGGSGGNTTTSSRRALHVRDRSLQQDFKSNAAGGFGGIVQSLPIPQAPLLAGSLPPSRFLDDLPPLSLGPQVRWLGRFANGVWSIFFAKIVAIYNRRAVMFG